MIGKKIFENAVVIASVALLGLAGLAVLRHPEAAEFVRWAKSAYWGVFFPVAKEVFYTPVFFFVVAGILVFEKCFPVKKDQKTFSAGFLQDMVWLVIALLTEAFVVSAYIDLLKGLHARHMPFLRVEAVGQLPDVVRFIWGALLGDFLSWFQHWVKHKVPWFWEIHAVHHSQRQMNVFTDFRFHFMEYFISRTITVIPLLVFAVDVPHIVAYTVFISWLTRFYHANIKMNFGPLRYIFVSPQSHRVHHSIERRHRDKNFGVVFSFWDRIFGTQWDNAGEYPDTGIEDEQFPLEMETTLLSVLLIPLKQTFYPFFKIARGKRKPG